MKTYLCDSCGRVMSNPYREHMREFYLGCDFDFGVAFPINSKRRKKIHLCKNCYKGLYYIAEKVGSENNV